MPRALKVAGNDEPDKFNAVLPKESVSPVTTAVLVLTVMDKLAMLFVSVSTAKVLVLVVLSRL